ncbi:MAG: hypothetical protein D6718_01345 [Acidobacteria bacterium]|nr:MAG: hypothetical protein D6718_01345 [Acidobacteriota bacterium]
MSKPSAEPIRAAVLAAVPPGVRVARGAILRAVARRLGAEPGDRGLRIRVARAVRTLEREGILVDVGPEVLRR